MSKTISYTVSDDDFKRIKQTASNKGLTPSQFTKTSVFSYINKYSVRSSKIEGDTKHKN